MKEHLIAGIDLGSAHMRLAAGQVGVGSDKRETLSLLGAVEVPSYGISKGSISSLDDTVAAISDLLLQAERQIGLPFTDAYIGIGGLYTNVQLTRGVIGVSRPDGEIRDEDISRVLDIARSVINPANYEILHVLPRRFSVDGQMGIKDPVGMQGIKLEVEAHIVQSLSSHVKNLSKSISMSNLDVSGVVFAPLATAEAVTSSRQRDVGAVVVNIGSTTSSIAVYEEGELLHAAMIPIGSDHITRDIANVLRTSLDIAELIKRRYASALVEEIDPSHEVDLLELGADKSELVSVRFISDIARARVEELFEKVEDELREIDRSGMLPAGAILTGGGAKLHGMVDIAKRTLRLPASLASVNMPNAPMLDALSDPAFSTAIGLVLWGFQTERDLGLTGGASKASSRGSEMMQKLGSPLKKIFKSFIP